MVESLVIDDPSTMHLVPVSIPIPMTDFARKDLEEWNSHQNVMTRDPYSGCTGTKPCVLAFASSPGADVLSMPPPGEAPNIGLKQPVAWLQCPTLLFGSFLRLLTR